jgi:Fe-S-cluster containining protein
MRPSLPAADQHLVQIVDAAFADSARRSGEWLVCRPGCTQCCYGPFAINQLDAARLRQGLEELTKRDSKRAALVRARAQDSWNRLAADFPGDAMSGILEESEEADAKFAGFADEEPCPALDPQTGMCDLYAHRPMTCRTFGPPVRSGPEGGLGVCELCYHGANDEEIAACEMVPDPDNLEEKLLREMDAEGNTIVAFCLARS